MLYSTVQWLLLAITLSLPILLVVSRTGKIKNSLSPFAPENLVSRDRFGRLAPRQPAHSPHPSSPLIRHIHPARSFATSIQPAHSAQPPLRSSRRNVKIPSSFVRGHVLHWTTVVRGINSYAVHTQTHTPLSRLIRGFRYKGGSINERHRITRMTGPDCAVMCNLMNAHTHTHTNTTLLPRAVPVLLSVVLRVQYTRLTSAQSTAKDTSAVWAVWVLSCLTYLNALRARMLSVALPLPLCHRGSSKQSRAPAEKEQSSTAIRMPSPYTVRHHGSSRIERWKESGKGCWRGLTDQCPHHHERGLLQIGHVQQHNSK